MAAEIVPLVTSMLPQMMDKVGKAASTPVIGIHHEHTSTSRKSHEVSKTEYDFSLRAWELVLGLGVFSVWEFSQSVAGLFKGVDPLWFVSPIDAFILQTLESDMSGGSKPKPSPQNMSLMQYLEAKIILSMEQTDMHIEDIFASIFPNGLPFSSSSTSSSTSSGVSSPTLQNLFQNVGLGITQGVTQGVIKTETGLGQGSGSGIPTTQGLAKVVENSTATAKKDVVGVVNTVEKKATGILGWIRSKL